MNKQENIMDSYPKNMKIKTFTQDCFDGATETEEAIKMKEKYLKRFHDLAYEFTEDCIKSQIESVSQAGFFFAWLWPAFVEGQIDASYKYLHKQEGKVRKVYKFEKVQSENNRLTLK